jgi:hypothetical protein
MLNCCSRLRKRGQTYNALTEQGVSLKNQKEKEKVERYFNHIVHKAGLSEKTFIQVEALKQLEHSRLFTKWTHVRGAKDDFDYMTTWSRIFED